LLLPLDTAKYLLAVSLGLERNSLVRLMKELRKITALVPNGIARDTGADLTPKSKPA
jgi:hypothetical protein